MSHIASIANITTPSEWIPGTSLLALSMSSPRQSVIGRGPGTNRIFILWFVLAVIGAMLSVYIPLLNRTLFTLPITAGDWLTVGLALIALIVCTELGKLLTRR